MERNENNKQIWSTAGKIVLKLVLLVLSLWPIGILEIYLLMFLPAMGMHPVLVVLFMLMPPILVIGVLFFKPRMQIATGWAITMLILLAGFGINMAWNVYDESITVNTNPNIDLELYLPFDDDSRIAVLAEESTLRFTLEDQLPRVDGAAAVFPVYSGFVNATYPTERTYYTTEKSFRLTTDYFQYNNTVRGYERLAEKRTDIFFGAYPSGDQIRYATEQGTAFNYTQIGSDAFVFFVHKDNPVENLTAQQIRDIYSGKITNWSQVGGKNEAIVAYQRNANSGSQSQLIRFMGGTPLMNPPKDWVSGSMGGIAQSVADYRSTTASIGFSFRYYIEGIIQNPDIKILSIDGVKPTVDTIRDGTYPLGGPLYAVTWEGNENENVQKLLDWVLSPQGQYIIEKTGYVPIGPTISTDSPTDVPTEPSTEPTTEPTEPPAEPTTIPTEPTFPLLGARNSFHDVYVYPYTQEDIDSAMDTVLAWIDDYKNNDYVLLYEVDAISFNPVGLDQRVVVYDPMPPIEHETTEDYYQNRLLLIVWRTVHYDGTLCPYISYDHRSAEIILYRESPDSPWQYYTHSAIPLAPCARQLLTDEQLAQLNLTEERVIAGYLVEGGFDFNSGQPAPYAQDTYVLYVIDEESSTVVCREYPAE